MNLDNGILAGRKYTFFNFPIDKVLNRHYNIIIRGKDGRKMKKYNLSKIMKRAWEMRRSYSCRSLTFSECLKRAWKEAKAEYQNSLVPEVFEDGMEITIDGYTRTLNRWSKGGHDRIYINGGTRNGDGFVDLISKRAFLRGNCGYQVKMAEKILAMAF